MDKQRFRDDGPGDACWWHRRRAEHHESQPEQGDENQGGARKRTVRIRDLPHRRGGPGEGFLARRAGRLAPLSRNRLYGPGRRAQAARFLRRTQSRTLSGALRGRRDRCLSARDGRSRSRLRSRSRRDGRGRGRLRRGGRRGRRRRRRGRRRRRFRLGIWLRRRRGLGVRDRRGRCRRARQARRLSCRGNRRLDADSAESYESDRRDRERTQPRRCDIGSQCHDNQLCTAPRPGRKH